MDVLPAEEIYKYAILAGFSPDQAVTMTAIALAESGGRLAALNDKGEYSQGLWQINADSHPEFAGWDMSDPLTNAKAAFSVSGGGQDISPWTTTHRNGDAMYLDFRDEAELAAQVVGDRPTGNWNGVDGYGDHAPAAGSGGTGAASALPPAALGTDAAVQTLGAPAGNSALTGFLNDAEAQVGDPYVWGVAASTSDADPDAFDCSELTKWAASRHGYELSDGTWLQYLQLKDAGKTLSVEDAINTPGALLFRFSSEPVPGGGRPDKAHVAVSLGDGRVVEAASTKVGVIYGDAHKDYNYAAVIPGISDGAAAASPVSTAIPVDLAVDTDGDGVVDVMESQLGLDAGADDTDGDGLPDGYEVLRSRTDATMADTDGDGRNDSLEISEGTDAHNADADHDGNLDGASGSAVDTDQDGLADALETMLGTNAQAIDSDADGFTDGAEYLAGFDPLAAASSPLAGVGTTPDADLDLST